LLGDEVVPIEFGGYTAGRITFGHRVLFGSSAIPLQAPEEYAQALTEAHVRVDVEVRRHTIRKALDRVCRTRPETRWREDHALVDKMTHMTEWPTVLAGGFDPEFLSLPEEVLVTVMRDHQNYFAGEDQTGRLAPHFLAVLNTEASLEGEAVIRHGNERVLRARFNDARFFWEFDQRTPLRDRLTLLEHVTFQKDLGSYAAKSHRNRILCERLAETSGAALDFEALVVAATLAKADLTAELVKEFTELQGIIGGLYARVQGMGEVVAAAIYDQYRPAAMDDRIPRTVEGQILAIADKADTIAGMFGLGMEPTGSKDPFALRRAANGVVKILAESDLKLGLGDIARAAANGNEPVVKRLEIFFAERLEFYLREARGQAYDVVKAVLAVGANDVRDAVARAEAVTGARGSADFDAVSAAFKRMQNVLAQAREKGIAVGSAIDSTLFRHPAEAALVTKVTQQEASVRAMRLGSDYAGALRITASLRPEVDTFFDAVMVMDPDAAVRANRLAVLSYAVGCFGGIADFSEIVVAG
jgi:glycyl-tRNA synthetase beta chain